MNKLIVMPMGLIAVGMGLLLSDCTATSSEREYVHTVKIHEVSASSLHRSTPLAGKIVPSDEAKLSFRIAGPIARIYVKPGTLVRKGQVLASLDARDYQIQLSATEAEYKRIKAEADRIIQLHAERSVSDNDYDKAVYGLQQITAKLSAHRNALSDIRLIAPYDGYVQEPLRKEGETVGAGMPVLAIYRNSAPEVEINLPAGEYLNRDKFASFSCSVDALPGKVFDLQLISIDPIANLNQLYPTKLRFASNEGDELPTVGMSTMVSIQYKTEEGEVQRIPLSSLVQAEGNSSVWVVEQKGDEQVIRALPVRVVEISRHGEVVVMGIPQGTKIVEAGVHALKAGDRVKPLEPVSQTNVGGLL